MDENYGQGGVQNGSNIPFSVGTNQAVIFTYDPDSHILDIEVEPGNFAVIHYFREDGDYGDHTTGDFNDVWGLHLWGDIEETIEWMDSLEPGPELLVIPGGEHFFHGRLAELREAVMEFIAE